MRPWGTCGSRSSVRGPSLTEDEIRAVISEGAESGVLEPGEESIVQRVFQLGDQRVAALMTPRVDIQWVDIGITTEDLRAFLTSYTHTEFVVCDGNLDQALGTVRAAELLPCFANPCSFRIRWALSSCSKRFAGHIAGVRASAAARGGRGVSHHRRFRDGAARPRSTQRTGSTTATCASKSWTWTAAASAR